MPTTEPVTDTQLANAKQIAPFASFAERVRALVSTAGEIAQLDANDPKSPKIAKEREESAAKLKSDLDRIAAEESAAKAPDRDRLLAFAGTIAALTVPPMSTPAGRVVVDEIGFQITKFAAYVKRKAETL